MSSSHDSVTGIVRFRDEQKSPGRLENTGVHGPGREFAPGLATETAPIFHNGATQERNVRISRELASAVSEEEEARLRERYQALTRKDLSDEPMARGERAALKMIAWKLDRIEDSRHGPALDRLEHYIQLHRSITADMAQLAESVE